MLMTVERKEVVERRVQLLFDFGEPKQVSKTRSRARKASNVKSAAQPIENTVASEPRAPQQLQDVCRLLNDLSRKYVPPTEFSDYTTLTRCTKILADVGVVAAPPVELQARISDSSDALVLHAPQYRLLKNRAIAGLATIADLAGKAPAKGSAEYQQGMRDAYEHASEIAVLFLEDIQKDI